MEWIGIGLEGVIVTITVTLFLVWFINENENTCFTYLQKLIRLKREKAILGDREG